MPIFTFTVKPFGPAGALGISAETEMRPAENGRSQPEVPRRTCHKSRGCPYCEPRPTDPVPPERAAVATLARRSPVRPPARSAQQAGSKRSDRHSRYSWRCSFTFSIAGGHGLARAGPGAFCHIVQRVSKRVELGGWVFATEFASDFMPLRNALGRLCQQMLGQRLFPRVKSL